MLPRYIPSVSSTDSHGSVMRGLLISESSFKHALLELLHYLNCLQRATGFKVISFAFRRFVHHKLFFLAPLVLYYFDLEIRNSKLTLTFVGCFRRTLHPTTLLK